MYNNIKKIEKKYILDVPIYQSNQFSTLGVPTQ